MATTPSIEVPIRVRPEALIPFHLNEMFRTELGRLTIVQSIDGPVAVRARDCDVLVDGERLRGVQAIVVTNREEFIVAVVVKTKRPEAVDGVHRVMELDHAPEVKVSVKHPETGAEIYWLTAPRARILRHDHSYIEDGQVVDPGYTQIDFIAVRD